jgi:hypothetical protein
MVRILRFTVDPIDLQETFGSRMKCDTRRDYQCRNQHRGNDPAFFHRSTSPFGKDQSLRENMCLITPSLLIA